MPNTVLLSCRRGEYLEMPGPATDAPLGKGRPWNRPARGHGVMTASRPVRPAGGSMPVSADGSGHAARSPYLLGESPAMTALRAEIDLAARTHARVLLVGETGVGKGNVARLIHAGSARRTRDFVAVNGGGLSGTLLASALFGHTTGGFTRAYSDKPGLAGRAHRGTLFLDELGEL